MLAALTSVVRFSSETQIVKETVQQGVTVPVTLTTSLFCLTECFDNYNCGHLADPEKDSSSRIRTGYPNSSRPSSVDRPRNASQCRHEHHSGFRERRYRNGCADENSRRRSRGRETYVRPSSTRRPCFADSEPLLMTTSIPD